MTQCNHFGLAGFELEAVVLLEAVEDDEDEVIVVEAATEATEPDVEPVRKIDLG